MGGEKQNDTIVLNGCTTDSGGGGTSFSLYHCMKERNLCVDDGSYLVGMCCLHTLQLTLSNAMGYVIGKGGLEERNAAQAIHAFFDMQEAMEFGLWKMHWEDVATKMGLDVDLIKVKKISAPILTRWWTVGEAAKNIIEHFPILIEMAKMFRNVNPSNNKLNKIASGILSLMNEPIIISDIKLISCFHDTFLNQHFDWLQKGDQDIGDTPGYLGRHMLVRYFLMHSDLEKMINNGWKNGGGKMEPFLNSLEEECLNCPILDPADPSKKKSTTGKKIQSRKADLFFQVSFNILQKHYDVFCERLLFLSLYGEQCSSQTVARVLLNIQDFSAGDHKMVKSEAQNDRVVDIDAFELFLKKKVDVEKQMTYNGSNDEEDTGSIHIHRLKAYLRLLAGK